MTHPLPDNILLEKWQDIGFEWQGDVAVNDLPRLIAELDSAAQANNPTLAITASLAKTNGILRLGFDIDGILWANCHRCLTPMAVDVAGSYGTALLSDNSSETLALLGDDEDYVLLDEIELKDGRYLPIKSLLEDELLLALPTVIAHDDCDMPIEFAEDETEERDNPFAVLAGLKGKLS